MKIGTIVVTLRAVASPEIEALADAARELEHARICAALICPWLPPRVARQPRVLRRLRRKACDVA